MTPTPENFPKLMALSALASVAVGMIVGRASGRWEMGAATAVFLFVVDWVGIRNLMK